jgi:hypothetical protein
MTVAEMSGDLPKADALFDASTPAEFTQLVAMLTHDGDQKRRLNDMFSFLLHHDWPKPMDLGHAHIGLENLLTLMFG